MAGLAKKRILNFWVDPKKDLPLGISCQSPILFRLRVMRVWIVVITWIPRIVVIIVDILSTKVIYFEYMIFTRTCNEWQQQR